jgi:hypothetical protein
VGGIVGGGEPKISMKSIVIQHILALVGALLLVHKHTQANTERIRRMHDNEAKKEKGVGGTAPVRVTQVTCAKNNVPSARAHDNFQR